MHGPRRAQSRKRHFLVASRGPNGHVPVDQVAKALRQPPMTLRQVIGDLVSVRRSSFMDEIPLLSPENLSRIEYLFGQQTLRPARQGTP